VASSPLARFLRLPAVDRSVFLRSLITLAAARVTVWVLPFRTVRRLLTPSPGRAVAPGFTPERVRWAIGVARTVVPAATCLPQALAAESLLARGGHPAELHIGVMKSTAGKFEAHAWVEYQGRIVVGDLPGGLSGYTRLPRLPDAWPGPRSLETKP